MNENELLNLASQIQNKKYSLLCQYGPSTLRPKRPYICQGLNPDGSQYDSSKFLFPSVLVLDISIRFGALILMFVNFVIYYFAFGRKKTSLTLLFFSILVAETIGIFIQWLMKANFISRIRPVQIYVAVFFFLWAAQVFNWVLYLRFNAISPYSRKLKFFFVIWLILESSATLASYCITVYGYITKGNSISRKLGTEIYMYITIFQTLSALVLSGHFIFKFYFPMIKSVGNITSLSSTPSDKYDKQSFIKVLYSGGLLYLSLEVLLHLVFITFWYISPSHYSSFGQLSAALRYALFLIFVFQLRNINTLLRDVGHKSPHLSSIHIQESNHNQVYSQNQNEIHSQSHNQNQRYSTNHQFLAERQSQNYTFNKHDSHGSYQHPINRAQSQDYNNQYDQRDSDQYNLHQRQSVTYVPSRQRHRSMSLDGSVSRSFLNYESQYQSTQHSPIRLKYSNLMVVSKPVSGDLTSRMQALLSQNEAGLHRTQLETE